MQIKMPALSVLACPGQASVSCSGACSSRRRDAASDAAADIPATSITDARRHHSISLARGRGSTLARSLNASFAASSDARESARRRAEVNLLCSVLLCSTAASLLTIVTPDAVPALHSHSSHCPCRAVNDECAASPVLMRPAGSTRRMVASVPVGVAGRWFTPRGTETMSPVARSCACGRPLASSKSMSSSPDRSTKSSSVWLCACHVKAPATRTT